MRTSKGQSSLEFIAQYSWALVLLVITLSAVLFISSAQRQLQQVPSYCYISPEFYCYQTSISLNTMGSNITTRFTNLQDTAILLTGYAVSPTSTGAYTAGGCNATVLQIGQSAACYSTVQGFTPAVGAQLNPVFYVQYKECSGTCMNASSLKQLGIAGTAILQVPPVTPRPVTTASSSTTSTSTTSTASTTITTSTTTVSGGPPPTSASTSTSSTSTSTATTTIVGSTISTTTSTSTSTSTSTTLASSTTPSTTSSTSTTSIQYEPVTLEITPSAVSTYWAACVNYTMPDGTTQPQTCTGYGQPSATVDVPYGSTINYLATAGWWGNGPYDLQGWSGISYSGNKYDPNVGSPVAGPVTITGTYTTSTTSTTTSSTTTTVSYSYSCGNPGPQNPGGGWQGPYNIQSAGASPLATPAYILVPDYGLGPYGSYMPSTSFGYSSGTFTFNWNSDSRSSENIYYGSFYLEAQIPAGLPNAGCWGPVQGNYYPTAVNGANNYNDPDSVIASNAGQGGPAATFQWTEGGLPAGNYRIYGYVYVHPNGGGGSTAWAILESNSTVVSI